MRKRILSLLLASSLLATMTGCNNKKATTDGGETSDNSKEAPYTLTVSWPVYGDQPADLGKVQDKVNEITSKKINMKVEFKPVSVTQMANTYAMAVSSGEKLDLISMAPTVSIEQYSQDKMVIPLDDLLNKHGKAIKDGLGDTLKAGIFDGKQYSIPTKDPIQQGKGILLLDSIVKKYNIDPTKIKTIDDLDPIFEKVHAGEPDMTMFYPFGVSGFLLNFNGQPVGLRDGGVNDTKYVNMFETQEYEKLIKKVRDWYLKGYISKDFSTMQTSTSQQMDANKLFCGISSVSTLNLTMGDAVPKYQVAMFSPVKVSAGGAYLWAVPVTAQKPEKSIQFLNLVFEDQELTNTLKYGIEGVHYVKNSDGSIDNSIGIKNYRMDWPIWGDPTKYLINKKDLVGVGGSVEKYKATLDEWNKSIKTSKAFGFRFDTKPVKIEISAVSAVVDQYQKLLEGGALEPDKYIKLVNEKMYAAGLQKVIDESQRQLDEWLKTQK